MTEEGMNEKGKFLCAFASQNLFIHQNYKFHNYNFEFTGQEENCKFKFPSKTQMHKRHLAAKYCNPLLDL